MNRLEQPTMMEKVLRDPCTSFWLKGIISQMAGHDPVDVVHDMETALMVAKDRLEVVQLINNNRINRWRELK